MKKVLLSVLAVGVLSVAFLSSYKSSHEVASHDSFSFVEKAEAQRPICWTTGNEEHGTQCCQFNGPNSPIECVIW
jgi:hypothetical protein